MRKFFSYFSIALSDAFAYKAAGFIWMLNDIGPAIVGLIFWKAAFNSSVNIGGYTLQSMIFYYLGIMLVNTLVATHPQYDLSDQIRSGNFSKYLTKPINITTSKIAGSIAWRVIRFIYLLPVILLINIYLYKSNQGFSYLNLNIIFLTLSLIMAFLLNFFIKMSLGLATFWFTEAGWLFFTYRIINTFLSGELIPLDLFPQSVFNLISYLPFKYMLFFPLSIALNKQSYLNTVQGLLIQLFWCLVFYLIYKLVLKKGIKVYEAYGN
ncbi:MAG: ABC-2 family transporter protein [Candidatus Beckwithbacteria bacterium]